MIQHSKENIRRSYNFNFFFLGIVISDGLVRYFKRVLLLFQLHKSVSFCSQVVSSIRTTYNSNLGKNSIIYVGII